MRFAHRPRGISILKYREGSAILALAGTSCAISAI
jgi:hypothetical protein